MKNIVDRAKEKWNKQADEHNQWDSLGTDEILQLVIDEEQCKLLEAFDAGYMSSQLHLSKALAIKEWQIRG
jgi:hypothetical protein